MPTEIKLLRSFTPQLRPEPTDLDDGVPMYNGHHDEPGLFLKTENNELVKIGPTTVGPKPPNESSLRYQGNCVGEMWLDTSNPDAIQLRTWTGSEWTNTDEVNVEFDQEINGQKTFTQSIVAQAGVDATGATIRANSLLLTGSGVSALTTANMDEGTLTTKSYVDDQILQTTSSLSKSLSSGSYLAGGEYNGTQDVTWDVVASTSNTPDTLVARDFSGSFSAGSATFDFELKAGAFGPNFLHTLGQSSSNNLRGGSYSIRADQGFPETRSAFSVYLGPNLKSKLTYDGGASFSNQVNILKSSGQDSTGFTVNSDNKQRFVVGSDAVLKLSDDILTENPPNIELNGLLGNVTLVGSIEASNLSAFKTKLANDAALATTIAGLRTAIIDALALL